MKAPSPIQTDGTNPFARYSMRVRVPKILDEVLAQTPPLAPALAGRVAALRDAIAQDGALPALGFPAPDEGEWADALERHRGATWLATEWFFAECYVYRALMQAVRYWETLRDPFAASKQGELATERPFAGLEALSALGSADLGARLRASLGLCLWGNRIDLSYAVGMAFGAEGTHEDLLVDDREWAIARLLTPGAEVHIVADNTGGELAADLALAELLISHSGAKVALHVKMHPTFVSDAIVDDVWSLLRAIEQRGVHTALASRLHAAFERGLFGVFPDFFWNGPKYLWDRPTRIAKLLDRASMVIVKGDANYRRVVGDAVWPAETPFSEATGYFPAPILCLRTMKSDALVGVSSRIAAALDEVDPEWRINGRRGLIQGSGR